jgi:secreted trypsin-like serine protease
MKRFLFILFLFLISLSVPAQKADIKLLLKGHKEVTGWQITDNQDITVFSGDEYLQNDSVTFSLSANRYYNLRISVAAVNSPDTTFLILYLNGEPLINIRSDIRPGDHIFQFYTGTRTINAKITGGTDALISDFPWQVYYISGSFRCGGSIISGRWVVTAAHCTEDNQGVAIPASSMSVIVGANDPKNKPQEGKTYKVSQVIVNAGFDNQTLLNDIALLKLTDSINFPNAAPIKLISAKDVAEGATVPGVLSWVTGWGLTHVSPNILPTALQKVQLPIVSTAQAATVWGPVPVTDLMAGYLNGNKDACNGDSGGPLVVPVLGEYKLAGIISWGSASCNTYGAYTSVSAMENWIRTNTGITTLFVPPSPSGSSIICQGTESSQYFIAPVAGATSYEWKVLPALAGTITGNSLNASILWNQSFTGPVNIIVRVTINNVVSDWSRLDANVVLNTVLLSQSNDTIICAGQPVALSVNAIGYNLTYKWTKDGQVVQTGSSPKLTFTSAITDNTGSYICEITGSCGKIVSDVRKLTVYPLTKITHISSGVEVPFGTEVTLAVNSDGHDLVYQWQKDGTFISNSNTPSLLLSNLNANDIGIYRTTVTGTCGVVVSDSIYLYVKRTNFTAEPEVFLWPSVTNNEFTVALSNENFYNIRIFSTSGKKFRELLNCRHQTRINISTMARGVYIVEISGTNFRKTIKIIKE